MPHRVFLCRLIFCAVFSVSLINIFTWASTPLQHAGPDVLSDHDLFCSQSGLADDVLVVLRTGATSSREKVPVHLRTTLRCVPNFVLFSDFEEEIEGHAVHDVLRGVSESTKKEHEDFELYNHLQEHGRKGLPEQKILTTQSGSSKGDYLNTDNAGWKLDKWKFLPMVDLAYQKMPQAKWFIFIEDDSYLIWNNLLEYLEQFDSSKPYYIGKHLYIQNIEFGYGGAGVILSNPAIQKVSAHRSVRIKDYEDFTATHWVGDCALGKILQDVNVPLHKAFPHLQGDSPSSLDPATSKMDRDIWCYPAITYHHVSPSEIEALWAFEQDWFKRHDILLRHRDIFTQHLLPQLPSSPTTPTPHWDNLSTDLEFNAHDHHALPSADPLERTAWKSFTHCHALCEAKPQCVQFSYESGSCGIGFAFRLGYEVRGSRRMSGWMVERVESVFGGLEGRCGVRDWFGPEREGGGVKGRRRRR